MRCHSNSTFRGRWVSERVTTVPTRALVRAPRPHVPPLAASPPHTHTLTHSSTHPQPPPLQDEIFDLKSAFWVRDGHGKLIRVCVSDNENTSFAFACLRVMVATKEEFQALSGGFGLSSD